jgi:hypothetical protein
MIAAVAMVGSLACGSAQAEDHVMAATKSGHRSEVRNQQERDTMVAETLNLSLKEAQEYAVKQNRSLRNASLAVQEAYAQRWQTIASMLPTLDGSYSYSNYLGYSATLSMGGMDAKINMPNVGSLGLTAAIGINGQGVDGVLLNNIAIEMKKIALEKSEIELRSSVMSAYVSVLALQSISSLLDSSLVNIQDLEQMTQNAVNVGAAEQTTADQIRVRVNTLKNNINSIPTSAMTHSGDTYTGTVAVDSSKLYYVFLAFLNDDGKVNTSAMSHVTLTYFDYHGNVSDYTVKGAIWAVGMVAVFFFIVLGVTTFMRMRLAATRKKMEAQGRLYPQ